VAAAILAAFLLAAGPRAYAGAGAAARTAPTVARADSLFARQDWKGAASAYGAIVKEDPENGFAWFRLGASLRAGGDYEGAIDAYKKAEAIRHNPLAMFQLASAYAHEKRDDLAFEWLTRAADAGFRWHQVYLDDPDFARLRPDPRFVAVETLIQQNSSPCTQRSESRQLDFWLGEWVCRTPAGTIAGKNTIVVTDRDCVILERWSDAQGEVGMSFNVYNAAKGQWQQTWMSGAGQIAEFSGEFREGAMRLEGYREGPNGERIPARLTLTPSGPETVRQVGENSPDGGLTWNVIYEYIYTRK
jgi:tetratricopeptide (TPR) repeat protein